MKDYRATTREKFREAVEECVGLENFGRRYARSDAPRDRKGLIAVLHPLCVDDETGNLAMIEMAKRVAAATNQRVYRLMDEYKWHLLVFADDDGHYDDHPGGEYANDQFIGYYDPDGTWKLVGCS